MSQATRIIGGYYSEREDLSYNESIFSVVYIVKSRIYINVVTRSYQIEKSPIMKKLWENQSNKTYPVPL